MHAVMQYLCSHTPCSALSPLGVPTCHDNVTLLLEATADTDTGGAEGAVKPIMNKTINATNKDCLSAIDDCCDHRNHSNALVNLAYTLCWLPFERLCVCVRCMSELLNACMHICVCGGHACVGSVLCVSRIALHACTYNSILVL